MSLYAVTRIAKGIGYEPAIVGVFSSLDKAREVMKACFEKDCESMDIDNLLDDTSFDDMHYYISIGLDDDYCDVVCEIFAVELDEVYKFYSQD